MDTLRAVSVPSFGDSFFIRNYIGIWEHKTDSFRPLIRGFFFYEDGFITDPMVYKEVSVPSFGDSFFIETYSRTTTKYQKFPSPHSGILFLCTAKGYQEGETHYVFPSPHSGILFLYAVINEYVSYFRSFRPLIRGFFFYNLKE